MHSVAAVHLDASLDLAGAVLVDVLAAASRRGNRVYQGSPFRSFFAFFVTNRRQMRTAVLVSSMWIQQQKTAVFTDVDGIATP